MHAKSRIALPKGRFLQESLSIISKYLDGRGLFCADFKNFDSRKLVFEHDDIIFLILKVSDICEFTYRGYIDLGIVPDEWILEYELGENITFNRLKELSWIQTRLSLISSVNHKVLSEKDSVASTFPNIAKHYFRGRGMTVDVYKINGSLEATIPELFTLGIDCIETGETLKQNFLKEREIIYSNLGLTAISYKKHIYSEKILPLL